MMFYDKQSIVLYIEGVFLSSWFRLFLGVSAKLMALLGCPLCQECEGKKKNVINFHWT